MMLQYPFIELFVWSRDIYVMMHAITLLNSYALKSSEESRKVYQLTNDKCIQLVVFETKYNSE
jgi:hypothetical protein